MKYSQLYSVAVKKKRNNRIKVCMAFLSEFLLIFSNFVIIFCYFVYVSTTDVLSILKNKNIQKLLLS